MPKEVILVDDGSCDGTLDQLQALAVAHEPGWIGIVALSENGGAASARNAGWSVATQPYLAFLDADDAWHPRKIELQYAYMQANPEVALCGHRYEVFTTPRLSREEIREKPAQPISKLSLLLSNRLVTPSVMLKRDVPHRFLPGRRHVDDHLLWLQLLCEGLPVVRLPQVLAYTYKPMYGAGGLSSELWKMELAELQNFWILRREACIGAPAALALSAYSFAKFLRRALVVGLRRLQFR
jgi:glycosyltransferase involved in cell wall biosynthesis